MNVAVLQDTKVPSRLQFVRGKVTTVSESTFKDIIGTDANFYGIDKDTLTRRYAIMRRVWQLNPTELRWITSGFMRRTTGKRFIELLDTSHKWKERIEYNNKLYELEFIDCNLDWIEDNPDAELLVSARENARTNFYCFLVKKIIGEMDGKERIREL